MLAFLPSGPVAAARYPYLFDLQSYYVGLLSLSAVARRLTLVQATFFPNCAVTELKASFIGCMVRSLDWCIVAM